MKSKLVMMAFGALVFASCSKTGCHECHYEDAQDQEVELGEYCDEDLEQIEKDGYTVDGTTYEVHCHEH